MTKSNAGKVWITVRHSDGDATQGPETGENGVKWVINEPGSAQYTTYALKCAAFLTSETDCEVPTTGPTAGKTHMCKLPAGFTLYTQYKRMPDKSERTDSYLYGLPHGKKFRSPNEFKDHLLYLAAVGPAVDDEEDPWFYIPSDESDPNAPGEWIDYRPIPAGYTKKCPCRYCNQAPSKPRAPGRPQGRGRHATIDPKSKRDLVMLMEQKEQIKEDNFWAISGLSAVEAQLTEHNTGPIRTGELCWYRGPINNFKPFPVVVCDIPNIDKIFHYKTAKVATSSTVASQSNEQQQELEKDIWERVSPKIPQGELSSYLRTKLDEATSAISLYTTPTKYRTFLTTPNYGVYICEYGSPIHDDDLSPGDRALNLRHNPGRYLPDIAPSFLTPYLAYPIPNKATADLDEREFLASLAATHITPFALLPWDHTVSPHPIRPRPNGSGTMAKYACAFLGAEKINQYDLVRVTGPGPDKLDMARIEAGYWKYLPLSLTEALMKVSCWIVYRDEDDIVTHINVRGQLYSPFPLKSEYEVKEVVNDDVVPIRHDIVRTWPGIQTLEDVEQFKMTWYQYFPSIPGEVEIPVYAENQNPLPSLQNRDQAEATKLEQADSLASSVMPLTPSNVKEQFDDFQKLRLEGIEAMRTDILTRWQLGWNLHSWEESLLRATDILGRFYTPTDLYAWATQQEYSAGGVPGLPTPLTLGSASVTKVAPQRAQAFGWVGFGTRDGKGHAKNGDLMPNLPASAKDYIDSLIAEAPGMTIEEMHWEEATAHRPQQPSGSLTAIPATEWQTITNKVCDLSNSVDQRVVRRIGPLSGSYEATQGGEKLWGLELLKAWERADWLENKKDQKRWDEYVEASLGKVREQMRKEAPGRAIVIDLDTEEEVEEEGEEEDLVVLDHRQTHKPVKKKVEDVEMCKSPYVSDVVVTPQKPKKTEKRRRESESVRNETETGAASSSYPERVKFKKRKERVEVSPDELSPLHPVAERKMDGYYGASPSTYKPLSKERGHRTPSSSASSSKHRPPFATSSLNKHKPSTSSPSTTLSSIKQKSSSSVVLKHSSGTFSVPPKPLKSSFSTPAQVRTPAPKIDAFFPKAPSSSSKPTSNSTSSSSSSKFTPTSSIYPKKHPHAFGGSGRGE